MSVELESWEVGSLGRRSTENSERLQVNKLPLPFLVGSRALPISPLIFLSRPILNGSTDAMLTIKGGKEAVHGRRMIILEQVLRPSVST